MLHTYNHQEMCLTGINTYTLRFHRYSPDKILKNKVTMERPKVKSRSRHDTAHLQPQTNVTTKYQLPTLYGFQDIARTKFYRSRSLRQSQGSSKGHTRTRHTFNPQPMSLPGINFLHLTVSKIYPRQDFKGQGHLARSKIKPR